MNLIVVGDSFCAQPHTWPTFLANHLRMDLTCYGQGGEHWWGVKKFLDSCDVKADVIVFAHTFGQRLPTVIKHTAIDQTAIDLYYKHIHNEEFLNWAQEQWFAQINREWGNIKVINLHCFPWTWDKRHLLPGVNVSPCLASISLNEVNAKEGIIDEKILSPDVRRTNHMNLENNQVLADELAKIIAGNSAGDVELDVTKFQQQTTRWFNWR